MQSSLLAGAAIIAATLPGFAQDNVTLDEIVIDGGNSAGGNETGGSGDDETVDAASTGDDSYVVRQTATGSKTDTPLREIPQSVSVITRKQIDDRQPAQLEDVIAYSSGVVSSPWGMDNRFDQCLIRGFDVCPYVTYRDGLNQRVIGFSGFPMEPYGLERVEVLKGPASVLYGENDVGGLVAATTKRPPSTALYDGFVSYGSFNTVEAGVDVGGPLDAEGVLSYRLTGLYRDGGTPQDYSENDRIYIAPALTITPNESTSLTLLANYAWDKNTPIYSVPVPGMSGYTGPEVSRGFFVGQPGFNRYDADHGAIGYQFRHAFDEHWTVRQNLRYSQQTTDYQDVYFGNADWWESPVRPDGHTIARTAYTVNETASIFNVDNQAQYEATFGAVENKLLVGVDYNRWAVDGVSRWGAAPDLDILNPDYSLTVPLPPVDGDNRQTVGQLGLYVQNQSKIADRLVVSLGGRQAWVDNRTDDRLNATRTVQKDDPFVWQAGVAYLFDNGVTPYASYVESFTVNLGQDRLGQNFAPSFGMQYEVGVKYEPTAFKGSITAALFDITKSNVLTTDPIDPNYSVQTGEVRHRGVELEAAAEVFSGLGLTAAYTFIDAEITRDNDGYAGNRPSLVPEHTASLWANYEFNENTILPGLSIGAGVRYVGQTFGDSANEVSVPAYTLVDAALRYRKGAWEGALNVSNLFDKKYFATCYGGEGCYYGEARNIRGSLNLKF